MLWLIRQFILILVYGDRSLQQLSKGILVNMMECCYVDGFRHPSGGKKNESLQYESITDGEACAVWLQMFVGICVGSVYMYSICTCNAHVWVFVYVCVWVCVCVCVCEGTDLMEVCSDHGIQDPLTVSSIHQQQGLNLQRTENDTIGYDY